MSSNRILEVFGKPKVLLPVIHTLTNAQVLESADIAMDNGADGVFLIDQHIPAWDVAELCAEVYARLPKGSWVGMNALAWSVPDAFRRLGRVVDGLWSDDAGLDLDLSGSEGCEAWAKAQEARAGVEKNFLWFGGAAFKYKREVRLEDVPALLERSQAVDVVTTSGTGTGVAPDARKMEVFRRALGGRALGVASGITPENVGAYLDTVDAFLVATGIEKTFGVLDPKRVRMLADAIHAHTRGEASP